MIIFFKKFFIHILFLTLYAVTNRADVFLISPEYEVKPVINYMENKKELFFSRPKIGLCLSGGGARGFCQAGVLKAFEDNNISIDYITGTSIGSLIGGLYASGLSPDSIITIINSIQNDWKNLFFPDSKTNQYYFFQKSQQEKHLISFRFNLKGISKIQGFSHGQGIIELLFKETLQASTASNEDFNRLKIPFRTVATNLVSGEEKIFSKGFLHDAIFSSLAVPSIIYPYKIDSNFYIDGGLVNNIPIDLLQKFNPDITITVNNISPLRSENELTNFLDIFDQITTITTINKSLKKLEESDFVISPPLKNYQSSDFNFSDSIINAGYEETNLMLSRIKTKYDNLLTSHLPDTIFQIHDIQIDESIAQLTPFPINYTTKISAKEIYMLLYKLDQTRIFSNLKAALKPIDDSKSNFILNVKGSVNKKIDSVLIKNFPSILIASSKKKISSQNIFEYICPNKKFIYDHPENIKQCIEKTNSLLREKGFALDYVKDYEITSDSKLILYITNSIVHDIYFKNLQNTSEKNLKRKITIKKNDIFNIYKLQKSMKEIMSTNLYSRATYQVIKARGEYYDIIFSPVEKSLGTINFGYQYNDDERILGYAQIGYDYYSILDNSIYLTTIFGKRNSVFLTAQDDEFLWSGLGYQLQYEVTDQRKDWNMNNHSIRYQQTKQISSCHLSGNYLKKIGVSLLSFHHYKINNYRGGIYPEKKHDFEFSYWKISNIIDTRDHLTYPTKGIFFNWNFIYSDSLLFHNKRFLQVELKNQINIPVTSFLNSQLIFEAGFSKYNLPYDLKFTLNSSNLFYVYGKDEAFRYGKLIMGGMLRYLLYNYQSDILRKNLYLVSGAVFYSSIDNFNDIFQKKKNKIASYFFGLNQNTVIGEIKLIFGIDNEKNKRISFFMGTHF